MLVFTVCTKYMYTHFIKLFVWCLTSISKTGINNGFQENLSEDTCKIHNNL